MEEIGYVILGTEHGVDIEQPLRNAAAKYAPRLIAEEYPFLITSSVALVAADLGIRYLQIDMSPAEQVAAGISDEMRYACSS